jgi:hypothetical protein
MFDQEFIDATREAQGEEAANKLLEANAKEASLTRMQRYRTDPVFAEKHPRMVVAIRNGDFDQATFPTDEAAAVFFANQESFLAKMGAPIPGQQPAPTVQPTVDPLTGHTMPTPPAPTTDPAKLGQKMGMIPWDQSATDAMTMAPISPGPAPGEGQELVAHIEALMEPEEGEFRRGRDRDFKMIKDMEAVNRVQGGTQELRAMRRQYEDEDTFPLS